MNKLWDPFAKEHVGNPYPMYAQLREVDPIHRSQSGDLVLTRYQEIKQVLLDSEAFRVGNRYEWISRQVKYLINKEEDLNGITEAMNSFLVQMNAPDHNSLRSLINDAWQDHNVENIIQENIDSILSKTDDQFDLVKDFAAPLPVMTIASIMGMNGEDYKYLKSLTADLLLCLDMYTSFKTLVEIDKAAKKFMIYMNEYLDYRSDHLSEDLTSKIILLARRRDLDLSRKQLISVCIFLFMAGEETTVNLVGTGAFHLMNNREQLNQLMDTNKGWDTAVNEALRFESPVQLAGRIANVDFNLSGFEIKKGDTLTLSLGAANRDPVIFNSPDQFDITRNVWGHLAFGAGTHFCLGSWLAKLQWKMAISSLFRKFPELKLKGDPVWSQMLSIRGLTSLPVGQQ